MARATDAFKARIRDDHGLNLSDTDYGRGRPALGCVGINTHSATAGIHTTVGSKVPAEYVPEAATQQRGRLVPGVAGKDNDPLTRSVRDSTLRLQVPVGTIP